MLISEEFTQMSQKITFADMHTHTRCSPDSKCLLDDMCLAQAQAGTQVFACTDHFDCELMDYWDYKTNFRKSISEIERCRELFDGKVKLLKGVELAEGYMDKELCRFVEEYTDYDVIISSIHSFTTKNKINIHSMIDFTDYSEEEIYEVFDLYFDDTVKNLECGFFKPDILAHLTYPSRYINGKYQRSENIMRCREKMEYILKLIIRKEIALEINTSNLKTDFKVFMPHDEIVRMYHDLGGKLITLGSDAHAPEHASIGFKDAAELAKSIGFSELYYYEKRKPVAYAI